MALKFLNNCNKAFSLRELSLFYMKALSETDLTVKLRLAKILATSLHSFMSFVLSVIETHLLYNLFCPPCVVLMSCRTDLFFKACPASNYYLKDPKD